MYKCDFFLHNMWKNKKIIFFYFFYFFDFLGRKCDFLGLIEHFLNIFVTKWAKKKKFWWRIFLTFLTFFFDFLGLVWLFGVEVTFWGWGVQPSGTAYHHMVPGSLAPHGTSAPRHLMAPWHIFEYPLSGCFYISILKLSVNSDQQSGVLVCF